MTEIAIFNQITEAADKSDHQLAKILDFTDDPRISDCLTEISVQQKLIKEMIADFDTSLRRFISSLREGKKPKQQNNGTAGTPTMCGCDLCKSMNEGYDHAEILSTNEWHSDFFKRAGNAKLGIAFTDETGIIKVNRTISLSNKEEGITA